MADRIKLGRALADSFGSFPRGFDGEWIVPTGSPASVHRYYAVRENPMTCECVDWALQRNRGKRGEEGYCKHIWAVLFSDDGEMKSIVTGNTLPSTTYEPSMAWEFDDET